MRKNKSINLKEMSSKSEDSKKLRGALKSDDQNQNNQWTKVFAATGKGVAPRFWAKPFAATGKAN